MRHLKILATCVTLFILASALIIVVNQSIQLVQMARSIHPNLGIAAIAAVTAVYGATVGVPLVLLLRLPKPLGPPSTSEGPEYDKYLGELRLRLGANPHLRGCDLNGAEGVKAAMAKLGNRADEVVKETASQVFLVTAVSQSGRLDGLYVLLAQATMIWKVAQIYQQRPSLREIVGLYANVAGTACLSGKLDDADLNVEIVPVLSSAVGSLGASVPGFQVAATVLVNSLMSGTANAFLTLRVGMIAKRYCGAMRREGRDLIRRTALSEAAALSGSVAAGGARRLTGAFVQASKNKFNSWISEFVFTVRGAGGRIFSRIGLGPDGGPALSEPVPPLGPA
jgi:hypothetical protein